MILCTFTWFEFCIVSLQILIFGYRQTYQNIA